MIYDYLIVGAGFAGAVCAQQLAHGGKTVLLIDRRPHLAGNAYDIVDEYGVLIHKYGPHIFHTNSRRIFEYLSQFTHWRFYEHRVLAIVDGRAYPFPINRTTINKLYGFNFNEGEVRKYMESIRVERECLATSEDVVLSSVGIDLCEKFYRGYTRKQWGLDLSQLSAGVAARVPTRTNDDDRYFSDVYQFMPTQGYTNMFGRITDHHNISVRLSTSLEEVRDGVEWGHMIYTGPIDEYYNFKFGKLPYRSVSFEHEHFPNRKSFQVTGTVNYPNDYRFTRITEFKYLTGQDHSGTSVVREYPQDNGDPYYPIPRAENESLYKQYENLARLEAKVTFVGRLAQYRYYNMDQVVGAALSVSARLLND